MPAETGSSLPKQQAHSCEAWLSHRFLSVETKLTILHGKVENPQRENVDDRESQEILFFPQTPFISRKTSFEKHTVCVGSLEQGSVDLLCRRLHHTVGPGRRGLCHTHGFSSQALKVSGMPAPRAAQSGALLTWAYSLWHLMCF